MPVANDYSTPVTLTNATPATYCSIGKLSRVLGVSAETLRQYEREGKLNGGVLRTLGGHRRYDLTAVKTQLFGLTNVQRNDDKGQTALYARVSSQGQKNSLELQKKELQEHYPNAITFSEIRSSFSGRKQLNQLIDAVIEGRVKQIVCTYKDRLSRIGALTRLIEHICTRFGCEIVYLNTLAEDPNDTFNFQEVVDYMCVIANTANGKKAGKKLRKHLADGGLQRAIELYNEGRSLTEITSRLISEGYKTDKGDAPSYHIVRSWLTNKVVEAANTKPPSNSFIDFVKQHYRKNEKSRELVADLRQKYVEYCKQQNIEPINAKQCAYIMRKTFGMTPYQTWTDKHAYRLAWKK
jgi:predicted site-specific integrase-resolvase